MEGMSSSGELEIGISCFTGPHFGTGGQKTHTHPLELDGAKSTKRDGLVDFLELKSYKQWKPTNGEGTSKKLKEGVERLFKLIKNTIETTFGRRPQA